MIKDGARVVDEGLAVDSRRREEDRGRNRVEVLRGQGDAIDIQEVIAAAERPLLVDAIGDQQVRIPTKATSLISAPSSKGFSGPAGCVFTWMFESAFA